MTGNESCLILKLMSSSASMAEPKAPLSRYQSFVVAMIAFVQFTVVLDFMVLAPLGALLMPELKIGPTEFGFVVSAYAFSAGIAGFLSAGFADRFDRKKILIFFYSGFVLGTLMCGLARTYEFLLLARVVTGLFGGVIGSTTLAIVTDLFSFEQRGRVMGIVQTSFAASQVLGIPLGLTLANHSGWNMPFMMIVVVSAIAGAFILAYLKPVDAHLKLHPDRNPIHHLLQTMSNRRYLFGFATTALLTTGGYMMMPFGSPFTVQNMAIPMAQLPLIYAVTGAFTLMVGPLVGKFSDQYGKFQVFAVGCVLLAVMVLIYSQRGPTSLGVVMLINVLMFTGVFTRIIASSALMSGLPKPEDRGAYMAVSSSIQQISGGVAAAIAGMIVVQPEGGQLQNFEIVGYLTAASTGVTLLMMSRINKMIRHSSH
jgi:predicted MFS family arabinose efflux permease